MTITMRIEGLAKVQDAIEALQKTVGKDVMRRVLIERAQPIADAARANAPTQSGELRDSIVVSDRLSPRQQQDAEETAGYVEVYVGPGPLPYAHLVEFGSIHNPQPEPFLRPAWDSLKATLLPGIAEDLWAEIEKAVVGLARETRED